MSEPTCDQVVVGGLVIASAVFEREATTYRSLRRIRLRERALAAFRVKKIEVLSVEHGHMVLDT